MKNIAGYFERSLLKPFLNTTACLKERREAWGSPSQPVRLLSLIQRGNSFCFESYMNHKSSLSGECRHNLKKKGEEFCHRYMNYNTV